MLLHHAFEASCARVPAKTAVVCGEARVSYAELASQVESLAALLHASGVVRGDRVVLLLESSVEFAVAVHAVLKLGAVFVPVSSLTKTDKLAYMLGDTRARALLTDARLEPVWRDAVLRSPALTVNVVRGLSEAQGASRPWPSALVSAPAPDAVCIDQDLAAIIYTSGTTGEPKGVMLTHRNMLSAWASVQAYLHLREDDVIGLALSPSFSYGLYHVLMGLGVGATLVLEGSAAFPVRLVERLARERVTVFPGVPTLYSAILALSNLSSFDLSSLRIVTNAAAALSDQHVQQIQMLLPSARLYSMYGMTECKRISYLPPEQLAQRPSSVGRGLVNQEVWLVDEEGKRLANPATGELVVRGSHVMRGSWDKPAETARALKPGPIAGESVLHTGDIFRTDAEGWLYFVGRSDDIIKSRGEKVAPREVENTIYALEGVLDCAVIGVPDERLGQAVKAFVTLKPGATLTEREVIRHCLARLENYMAPKSVEFVADLPRTDSGKIRKLGLR
ncbi:MAG: class I adenylate-forming enzyme family protein [Burkholderiales bacterium]|nr:class I adenylate-forming enzyme family protein [Burkholderiales bacterium]